MREIQKTIDINSHIVNIKCTVNGDGDFSKAIISFDNLGYGVITAVKFNAQGYNSFGDIVQINGKDKFFLIIQDIRIEKNSQASELKARLPSGDIRKLDLEECQICYSDGSVSTYSGADNRDFSIKQFDGFGEDREILNAIKDELGDKIQYLPQEDECGWICGCGRYNGNCACVCSNCGNNKDRIFKITDSNHIATLINEHRRKETERKERAKQEEIRKNKEQRKRKVKISVGVVVAIAFAVFIGNAAVMANRTTYASEAEMKDAVEGVYTFYDGYKPKYQLRIKGNTVTERWCSLGSGYDMDLDIKAWNPSKGSLEISLGTLTVTKAGDIKYDGDLYEKGGSWTSTANGSLGSSHTTSYESAYSVLKFSNLKVSSNSSYTICTGTLKNTGEKTYKYVEVKGAFKNSSGDVIDTDWTYAVGSEGLAPGESTTFRMSVDKNYNITSCSVSILDYN